MHMYPTLHERMLASTEISSCFCDKLKISTTDRLVPLQMCLLAFRKYALIHKQKFLLVLK